MVAEFEKLFEYANNGDLDQVKEFLADPLGKKLVNLTDKNRRTPLIMASHRGHSDVVEFLLESGADWKKEAFDAFIAIPGTSKSWVRTTPGAVAHSGEKREERIFRQSHGNVGLENTKTRLPVCESKSSAI